MGCTPSNHTYNNQPTNKSYVAERKTSLREQQKPAKKKEVVPVPGDAARAEVSNPGPEEAVEEEIERGEQGPRPEPKPEPEPEQTPGEAAVAMDAPITDEERKTVGEKVGVEGQSTFNVEFAMEQVGEDAEFLVELKETLDPMIADITGKCLTAVHANEWKAVFEKAHAYKGAVASVGMDKSRVLAYALEQSGRILDGVASGSNDKSEIVYSPREILVIIDLIKAEWDAFEKVFPEAISSYEPADG